MTDENEIIDYAHFSKVKLKIATVLEAEAIEGSDKLLRLQIDLGDEKRQLVAGIAKSYKPEDLINKQIVVVSNLAPRKIRGVESNGMLLASGEDPEGIVLLTVDKKLNNGSSVM